MAAKGMTSVMASAMLIVVPMLVVGAPATARAQAPAPAAIGTASPAKATVSQLAWIAGPWAGTLGERRIEQHWMAPAGNAMVAMFRSVQQDKAMLYELLAIEQEGEGVVLRIKHFAPGPGLVGRQAKDESVNHPLVRVDGRTAVFEGGAAGSSARITFTSPNADTLTIVVERVRDGAPVATEFKYTRLPR